MHSALTEVGILYASSEVHQGWEEVGADGQIPLRDKIIGGHAFAIIGYDERGFWIQNSWGRAWGKGGFGLIGYDDWLTHGSDIWVAHLGVPVESQTRRGTEALAWSPAGHPLGYTHDDLRAHIIGIGNKWLLRAAGNFGFHPGKCGRDFRRAHFQHHRRLEEKTHPPFRSWRAGWRGFRHPAPRGKSGKPSESAGLSHFVYLEE